MAFTLTEVLVTLGIIGIVTALTMPALIANYKEKVLVSQVKKSYSQMQNALKLYAAKNECSEAACISDTNGTDEDITKKLFEAFNGGLYCNNSSNNKECKNYGIKSNTPTSNDSGTADYTDSFTKPFFISRDGATYKARQYSSCIREATYVKKDENGFTVDEDGDGKPDTVTTTVDLCAIIYFDANGLKGPNQFGADVYRIDIRSNGKIDQGSYITKTLSDNKLYYTPYNIGDKINK